MFTCTPIIITSSTDWMRVRPSTQAVRRNRSIKFVVDARKSKLITLLSQKGNPI